MSNGNGKRESDLLAVRPVRRFDKLWPIQTADRPAASTPVLQMLLERMSELDRKVDALATSQTLPATRRPLEVRQPEEPTPQQLDRGKLRRIFD